MNEKDFYPNDISPTEEEIVYINLRASFLASIETHKQRVNLILYINQPNVRKEYSDLQWKVGKLLEAISRSKDALTLST